MTIQYPSLFTEKRGNIQTGWVKTLFMGSRCSHAQMLENLHSAPEFVPNWRSIDPITDLWPVGIVAIDVSTHDRCDSSLLLMYTVFRIIQSASNLTSHRP